MHQFYHESETKTFLKDNTHEKSFMNKILSTHTAKLSVTQRTHKSIDNLNYFSSSSTMFFSQLSFDHYEGGLSLSVVRFCFSN
jgi:hypothetical protein